MIAEHFSASPYPPPEMLARYNEAIPGSAEKLLAMLAQESKHRRELEVKELDAEIADQQAQRQETARGQLYGLIIGNVAIVVGGLAAILGAPVPGAFIGTGGVVGLVAVFVLGRYFVSKESQSPPSEPKE